MVGQGAEARGLGKGSFVRVRVVTIGFFTRTSQAKSGTSRVQATEERWQGEEKRKGEDKRGREFVNREEEGKSVCTEYTSRLR